MSGTLLQGRLLRFPKFSFHKIATTNAASNPFVGSWTGEGVTVTVRGNLTWSASAQGYSNSGSYSPIDNAAIVYDSKKELFGYATITTSGQMKTFTDDGGDITFTKR